MICINWGEKLDNTTLRIESSESGLRFKKELHVDALDEISLPASLCPSSF